MASLLLGFLSATFIAMNYQTIAIILLLLSGYLDILDGSISRINKGSSDFGAFFDIMSDRCVETAVIIALAIRQPEITFVALCMVSAIVICISSFLTVAIFTKNTQSKRFYYSEGLMERAEAFIFFISMILLPEYTMLLGILFSLFVLWTAIYRTYEFYKQN